MTEPDGVISLSERFKGVEAALTRIETKLDNKVDHSDFQPFVHRVELIEAGETPLGRFMMKQFEDTQSRVSDLVLHGSTHAREATDAIRTLEKDVEVLRFESQSGRALNSSRQTASLRIYRIWGIVLSCITTLSIAISTYAVAASVH